MDGIMEIVKGRRSVRAFTDEPVADEIIVELLTAAVWAPSGGNIQPWLFGVVRDGKRIGHISSFSPGLNGRPPALIVICIDERLAREKGGEFGRDALAPADAAMAAQNIMLLATEKGLGTCAVKSFNPTGVSKILKLPAHVKPELILTLGRPARTPKPPARKPLSQVAFYEEWGGEP